MHSSRLRCPAQTVTRKHAVITDILYPARSLIPLAYRFLPSTQSKRF